MKNFTQTSLAISLFLFACTPSIPAATPTNPKFEQTAIKKVVRTLPISFTLEPGFSLKQTAQAAFVHLVIEGKDSNGDPQVIFANGADENTGFIEVTGSSIALGADVPEGDYWTVTAGFYSNPSADGKIFERMAAFSTVGRTVDSPPVEINALSHPVGEIIKKLYSLGPFAFGFSTKITINGLQGFINGLVGAPTLSRLNELDNEDKAIPDSPKNTFDLNTDKIAIEIAQGFITPATLNEALGISYNPQDFRRTPYLQSTYELEPHTDGLRETLALNTSTGNFFFNDVRGVGTGGQTISADEVLYGVNYSNNAFSELFKTPVGNVKSLHVSLGLANTDGANTKLAIYLTRASGQGLELVAYDQADGSELWTFDFNGNRVNPGNDDFTPFAFKSNIQPGQADCGCGIDDFDYVYTAFGFDNTFANPVDATDVVNNGTGIYKLYSVGDAALGASSPFGTSRQAGFYAYPGDSNGKGKDGAVFRSTGALNSDGSRLYVVNLGRAVTPVLPPELIVINTSDMSQVAKVDLSPYYVRQKSAPVIGADGTVYLAVFGNGAQAGSYLMAFNADGSSKWSTPLQVDTDDTDEPDYPPVVDFKSSKNQIYLHINDNGKVVSVRDNGDSGSISWTRTIGSELRSSPILAETATNKYLYLGSSDTGQTMALNESDGSIIWSTSVEGSFASGFNFFDNHLFLASKDGNDNSNIRLRAVKVEAQHLTYSAPWAKSGSSESNAGVAKQVIN